MKKLKFHIICIALFFAYNATQAQIHYVNTTTNDKNSSAIGKGTVASGEISFASGINSTAEGICSTALGQFNEALGHYSVTIGSNLKAMSMRSMIIGNGYSDYFKLENNILYSLMIGFDSQYPTLFVSRSSGYDKTGRIGIGNVTSPEAKLHLRADEGEEAAVFIEPHIWENGNSAKLYLGNKANGISAESQDGMTYHTENNHIFEGGDVYIKDIDKGIIMKSPDGKCWRGTLNNDGSLGFVQLDACPGQTVSVKEHPGNEGNTFKVYPNPAGDFITVSLNKTAQQLQTVKLLNQDGITLVTKNLNGNTTRVYIGDLPAGIYLVQVNSGNKKEVKRFVKR